MSVCYERKLGGVQKPICLIIEKFSFCRFCLIIYIYELNYLIVSAVLQDLQKIDAN